MFRDCAERAAELLRMEEDYETLAELGRHAASVDTFAEWEVLMMEAMIGTGRYAEAEKLHAETVGEYVREFGSRSNEYVRSLINRMGKHTLVPNETIGEVQERLRGSREPEEGRVYCTLPVFQELYQMMERTMKHSGDRIILMLCTVVDGHGDPMKEGAVLTRCSERLRRAIFSAVRSSDTVTRYGKGQYLILLTDATRETCDEVMRRIDSGYPEGRRKSSIAYSLRSLNGEEVF
jgi:hypothetical protein